MAEKKKPAKHAATSPKAAKGFTPEEKAAMRERAKELKASGDDASEADAVVAKLAAMKPADRAMGERLHKLIMKTAPELTPRLWYGMPAYAKDGRTICFFQDANKFKSRYATLGFSDKANLDQGRMWPIYYALLELTPAEEERIVGLLKQAIG